MITFDDSKRLFVSIGYDYGFSKFAKIYEQIIIEHAEDLFTPKKLLEDTIIKLSQKQSLIHYFLKDLQKYANKEQKNDFTNAINIKKIRNDFELYILYCDPIKDIQKLNWKYKNQILQEFKKTPFCPAKRFFASHINIIVLNAKVIDSTDLKQLELQLDHELNHLFSSLSNKAKTISIEDKAKEECKKFLNENKIISNNELQSFDFNVHMFNDEEFYEMIANVCNVLSLYFKEKDSIKLYDKFYKMLNESFLKSDEFKKMEEPIRGAIIFAFICKKYAPDRWNRVIKAINVQLNTNYTFSSFKLSLLKIKQFITNFIKRILK